MRKKQKQEAEAFDPVYCLTSIFTARRDLLESINREVLRKDAPVTVDEADALIFLFGIRELGWTSLPVDDEGYVAVGDLRLALVHDRGLFSRRIQKLQQDGLIEGKQPLARQGSRRYVNAVRITETGIKVASPIWKRYRELASKLLAGQPPVDLEAQCSVNQRISEAIRKLKQSRPRGPD
jgi:DNA-binding MarR family transcriptional regulator